MSVSLEEFDRVNFENSCNRLDKPSGYLMKRAVSEKIMIGLFLSWDIVTN